MIMKITKQKFGAMLVTGFIFSIPLFVSAAGLVPCGDSASVVNGVQIPAQPPCDFNFLIKMANNIIHFLIYDVFVPLSALMIMYAGGRLALMPNKEEERNKAKEIFKNIGIGIAIMIGAFVLIKFVLYQFLNTDAGFTLFLIN